MSQLGGPGALNGFLYQILQHIGRLAETRISSSFNGNAIGEDWVAVLEPESGGDAQLFVGEYVVEQYKVRSGGTWSLSALIDDVLRGLRRAVPDQIPPKALYRFVTDGRPGRDVEDLLAFFNRLRTAQRVDQIDEADTYSYAGERFNDARLFQRICEATRVRHDHAEPDERDRVFHLLTHFEVDWAYSEETLVDKIDHLLSTYFPGRHDIETARVNLLGQLFIRLSKGEARFTVADVDQLFIKVNLDPEIPKKFAKLAETLADLSDERLAKLGYVPLHDVRRPIDWPADRPVLVITGDSGNGKTWQLARLVRELAIRRKVVTWSSALSSSSHQLQQVTEDIWNSGLHQVGSRTLAALELLYREWISDPGHWLTVAVDDVTDAAFAKQLVQRDWNADRARLAITAPVSVADDLQSRFPGIVHVVKTSEFTFSELDAYLRIHGRKWSELPDDLKELLRKPILARLYTQLPYTSFERAPRSEYEIFDRFWEQMRSRSLPGDPGILLLIAAAVLDKKAYPIPRSAWLECAADGAAANRLISFGWLTVDDSGAMSFAHDRLLNWAVAMEVVRRATAHEITDRELATLLLACFTNLRAFQKPLGYVLMDALWLLASRHRDQFDLDAVLGYLEEDAQVSRDLYEELLPSLGQFAMKLFLTRIRGAASASDWRAISLRKGLERVARQEDVSARDAIDSLLATESRDQQRLALKLLQQHPSADYLETLWAMRHWNAREAPDALHDSPLWSNAIRACVALRPEWLVERCLSPETTDSDAIDLAYVLAGLESPDAAAIWTQVRGALTTRVPKDRSRGVVYCISRFCDTDYMDYVLDRLETETDFLDSAALPALVRLSPTRALGELHRVTENTRYFTVRGWLPPLLELRPAELRPLLLKLHEGSVVNALGLLFHSRPDDMGPELLEAYLDAFEADLQTHDRTPDRNDDWLFRPTDLLSRISHVENLGVLRKRRGSPLERLLVKVATRRIAISSNMHDYVLEGARLILLRIASSGFIDLVVAELQSAKYWGRHSGLRWASAAGKVTRDALHAIAVRPADPSDRESNARMESYLALTELAAIGADEEIVDVVWRTGTESLSRDLADLRGQREMDPVLLTGAFAVLTQPSDESQLQRALAVAWLSGDVRFVPLVRALLPQLLPDSLAAALAFHALFRLKDGSREARDFAECLLQTEKSRWMGINLLASFGESGYSILKAHLDSRPVSTWDHLDRAIIEILHEYPPTKAAAVQAAADISRRRWIESSFEIAAESESEAVREHILRTAFSKDRTVVGRTVEAARAISHFDSERALEAAEAELMATARTADSVCRLAFEVAGEDALKWLISMALRTSADRRPAIGRALRRLNPDNVRLALSELGRSEFRNERILSVNLAGWTEEPTDSYLRTVMETDSDGKVRDAALAALQRRRDLRNSKRLLTEIASEPELTQWSMLQALIASTPPQLLTDRRDELWLGHALNDMPPRFVRFAQDRLRNRKADKEDPSDAD